MENGVKMYFNGMLTEKQLITIVIAVVALIIILSIAKKVLKVVLSVTVLVAALMYFNIVSPDKLLSIEKVIEEQGSKAIEEIADASENIKISTEDKEINIQIKPDNTDEWINLDDISKMVTDKDDCITIIINENNSYNITDKNVIKLLKLFKK